MEILRYVVVILAVMAGISVLRNPLKVWSNTLAGTVYFAGAAGSLFLQSWWPLVAGWIGSLSIQAIVAIMIAKGVFNRQVNALRAKKGLPPWGEANVS